MTTLFLISYAALWVVVVVQGFAFLEVLRQIGAIREQVPPERPLVVGDFRHQGEEVPPLSAVAGATLRPASWDEYLTAGLNVALFLTPRCPHCYAIAQDLAGYAERLGAKVGLVAVLRAPPDEAQKFIAGTGLDPALVAIDSIGQTAEALGIRFTPGAVLVQGRRLGQAAIVTKIEQLDALVDRGLIGSDEIKDALEKQERERALREGGRTAATTVSEVD